MKKRYKIWITFESEIEEYENCSDIVFNNSGFFNFLMHFDDKTFVTIGINTSKILMYEVQETINE